MSDTATPPRYAAETGERFARLEQIADDTRRSLDRLERGIEKVSDRIEKVNDRIEKVNDWIDKVNDRLDTTTGEVRSQFRWTVGLLFSLALAMLAGFGTLFQSLSKLAHP